MGQREMLSFKSKEVSSSQVNIGLGLEIDLLNFVGHAGTLES